MKLKILSCLLVFLFALPALAAPPKGKLSNSNNSVVIDNTSYIDVNRIFMFVTNHGNFGRDLGGYFGYDYGTFYPYLGDQEAIANNDGGAGDHTPNYASGLWVGGVVNNDTLVVISEYSSEYVPGPMSGGTFQTDNPNFRVYKLYKDSLMNNPNQDYIDYMQIAYPTQGAPVVFDSLFDTTIVDVDTTYTYLGVIDTIPAMVGDQLLWCVYNDADPTAHSDMITDPLGIEVKQTVFGFNREDPLGEIIFIKYQIYNNGSNVINDCYFSLWADPDLGSSGDDLVGCDIDKSLGFVYNATNSDNQYGSRPPSMGFDFFQGPLIARTAETADLPDGKMWGTTFVDSVNLGMVSFNKYINGTDPDNYAEVYMYMEGLDAKIPGPYVYNGDTLLYQHAGDPVKGTGDLDGVAEDKRWMQTTGPVTFAPGDSTEILAAIVLGTGGDRKSSISVMKYHDQFAQTAYDIDFDIPEPPAPPVVTSEPLDGEIALYWTDASEVAPGDYPFQGYTVYQGENVDGVVEWTRIANYDIIDGEAIILDLVLDPQTGVLETRGIKFGSDNGIQRYFVVDQDYINGGDLINLTDYFFKVEAYSLSDDPNAVPKTLTSSSAIVKIEPRDPLAGTTINAETGGDIPVEHATGGSQGLVWVEVVDPAALTGHTYNVVFSDTSGETTWSLIDVTTGTTILDAMSNQTGDNDYFVTDGFVVRVSGPSPSFLSFEVVANANGVVDPPDAGALWFGGFPVPLFNDPDGYITDAQQSISPAGQWGLHTADNGGTCDGGTRGSFEAFMSRATRDEANFEAIGAYDYEMRFTGSNDNPGVGGSYAIEWYNDDNVFWVPFELWRTGIGTPDDPSDDVRLIPLIIDDGNDNTYNLESWGCDLDPVFGGDGEHSVSGGDNDPFTDWVYWREPLDLSPGQAGYDAAVAKMQAGTLATADLGPEILARTVLVSWNGGSAPPFVQDLPELGTVFRLITAKPNLPADTFAFDVSSFAPTSTMTQADLDKILPVPNPYYLNSAYDPAPGSNELKFHHLPAKCTISIYNLAGTLIATIDKDDPTTNIATWDVLTDNGLPVASGIYIYVVDAPGYGQKIGKMAIFVEQEVLRIY